MNKKRVILDILRHVFIVLLCAFWLIPIVWLLATSFSAYPGRNTSDFFPKEWTLHNYVALFGSDTVANFKAWFMNTFKIAVACCIVSTLFTIMVAYATSFSTFKARKPMMNIAVILNLFPGVLAMISVYFILKALNLTNTHLGLTLVYCASSGLGYLIAKGFFDTVPRSLCEAAKLDGASQARTFFTIIMPLSKPIIVYTIISSFLTPWTDFVFAKMILNSGISDMWTVSIGLYNMLEKSLINSYFSIFCAGGVVVSIPISILFVIMQKFYVDGITGGAVKG
ncbi:MAG: ABC transporter permease subunit [Lachnospiraceae bacterium]|nr:ABC transporter permease subunit [Ruminococcus sp.]MCM1274761.1 ABC transporter permease subunit [Lachnospiraceae bacterium]